MSPIITRIVVGALAFVAAATTLAAESDSDTKACRQRVQVVTGLRGCVAFWDFVETRAGRAAAIHRPCAAGGHE